MADHPFVFFVYNAVTGKLLRNENYISFVHTHTHTQKGTYTHACATTHTRM